MRLCKEAKNKVETNQPSCERSSLVFAQGIIAVRVHVLDWVTYSPWLTNKFLANNSVPPEVDHMDSVMRRSSGAELKREVVNQMKKMSGP
jgi:hypothetical protein